jgi:hypothetical protein
MLLSHLPYRLGKIAVLQDHGAELPAKLVVKLALAGDA